MGHHVLIVDDNEVFREWLAAVLESGGHQVFAAAGGIEGKTMFKDNEPDVVIVDMFMPDHDGVEFIREIKGLGQTRIIAVSGGSSYALTMLKLASTMGAAATLSKPFSAEEILSAIGSNHLS